METIRQQIEALPEPERTARKSLYTDAEWRALWELNAFPFQLPPKGGWDSWTVIAPPRTGKTTAGLNWVHGLVTNNPDRHTYILIIVRLIEGRVRIAEALREKLFSSPNHTWEYNLEMKDGTIRYRERDMSLEIEILPEREESWRGLDPDYVWGDEVLDAEHIRRSFPFTKQFCFTNPTKLDSDTIVTRPYA